MAVRTAIRDEEITEIVFPIWFSGDEPGKCWEHVMYVKRKAETKTAGKDVIGNPILTLWEDVGRGGWSGQWKVSVVW